MCQTLRSTNELDLAFPEQTSWWGKTDNINKIEVGIMIETYPECYRSMMEGHPILQKD